MGAIGIMKKRKCAAQDYTENDFPLKRKDVFVESYREHFSLIFRLGLLSLLFLLPSIIVSFMCDVYITSTLNGLKDATEESIAAVYYSANLWYGLFLIVAKTLFAVLFVGILQIIRQLLWNEPIFFGDDFKNGLKSNALRCGILAFLFALRDYACNLFSSSWISLLFDAIFYVQIIPVAIWVVLCGLYYKIGVFASIKNALLLYFKTFPVTILLLVCTVLPFWLVISFIPLLIVKYIVLIVLAVFYIVPIVMCWVLYALHVFDKFINKENYPEFYRKGLRKENEVES